MYANIFILLIIMGQPLMVEVFTELNKYTCDMSAQPLDMVLVERTKNNFELQVSTKTSIGRIKDMISNKVKELSGGIIDFDQVYVECTKCSVDITDEDYDRTRLKKIKNRSHGKISYIYAFINIHN